MKFNQNSDISLDFLHKSGGFLTVKANNKINTMTISWGSVGFMWAKPVFMVLVRPTRYTYEFIENSDNFTVSIPYDNDEMKKALKICGSKSGRDIDKCKLANISFLESEVVESPIVDGCNMYYECKIVYKQKMDSSLIQEEKLNQLYNDDYHVLYYGEIVSCYQK